MTGDIEHHVTNQPIGVPRNINIHNLISIQSPILAYLSKSKMNKPTTHTRTELTFLRKIIGDRKNVRCEVNTAMLHRDDTDNNQSKGGATYSSLTNVALMKLIEELSL